MTHIIIISGLFQIIFIYINMVNKVKYFIKSRKTNYKSDLFSYNLYD